MLICLDKMQIMNAITFDLAELPDAEREALQRDAARREVPIEELVREALLGKAERIMANTEKRRRRTAHHAA